MESKDDPRIKNKGFEPEKGSYKKSSESVGELYPVLKDEYGIIDGFHRKADKPEWHEKKVKSGNKKEHFKKMLHANFQRRIVPEEQMKEWINGIAKELKNEGVTVPNFVQEIFRELGNVIADRTIYKYLNEEYKKDYSIRINAKVGTEVAEKEAEKEMKQELKTSDDYKKAADKLKQKAKEKETKEEKEERLRKQREKKQKQREEKIKKEKELEEKLRKEVEKEVERDVIEKAKNELKEDPHFRKEVKADIEEKQQKELLNSLNSLNLRDEIRIESLQEELQRFSKVDRLTQSVEDAINEFNTLIILAKGESCDLISSGLIQIHDFMIAFKMELRGINNRKILKEVKQVENR